MKIAVKQLPYREVLKRKRPKHKKPLRPNFLLQTVIRVLAIFDLYPRVLHTKPTVWKKSAKKNPA